MKVKTWFLEVNIKKLFFQGAYWSKGFDVFISDLNLLDWSVNNHLAVALGSNVYLWNASTGDITPLLQLDNPEEYVGAVSWVAEGNILGVGTSGGEVQVGKLIISR